MRNWACFRLNADFVTSAVCYPNIEYPKMGYTQVAGAAVGHGRPRGEWEARGGDVDDDVKETIDQVAQSLQIVTLLATQLRRELAETAQQVVDLEAAADKAVRTIKRLHPRKNDR